ncbi:MAG TPA: universal stress protein [Candidatus Dormibacteraeota bacterium]
MSVPFRHILFAVTDAADTRQTAQTVLALARAFSSDVTVLHARERIVGRRDEVREEESIEDAERYGETIARELQGAGIRTNLATQSVRPDRLADLILGLAEAQQVDLIVIGGHHAHSLRESVFGDIGRSLVHGANCPVLLMPSPPG